MAQLFAREGEELEALVRRARAANLTVSLDLSLPDPNSASGRAPWRKILQRVLPYVDHFFPSDTELAFMLQRSPDETDAMIDECLTLGANAVILKRGDLGLVAGTRSSSERITHPCFAVDAVGTTGAGDATIAGFLMGYLRGFSFAECLRAGCAVGATSVEAMDAVTAITPWPITEARIASGWPFR
jgi:sugar/nucleoside kinase (ribokinase family)